MCGICGIARVDTTANITERTMLRMRESLAHRGPDGSGQRVSNGVGLVHTRLSIIDVSTGQQPLSNEDGSVWITFNGEIYNYAELRRDLVARGHQFRTQSDTEVIVHLYEELGADLVTKLNGMFAFAIHDENKQRVVLARDHFGIKPLFYSIDNDSLIFGSEIKSVVAGLGRSWRTTTAAVQEYLLFRSIGQDRSFFDGVHRLPPASVAVWERGSLSIHEYWSPPTPQPDGALTFDQAVDQLEEHLETAVRSQLMSEVPLGTYCSGGVDSGLTSLYSARQMTSQLQTFSVGFSDTEWDETPLAMDTARRIGSNHRVLTADPAEFLRVLPKLIWHHDEPLGHPNSVLIALLSEFARRHVTVVLTGEGSDELFGGYPRHHIAQITGLAKRWPDVLQRLGASAFARFGGRKGRLLANSMELSVHEAIVMNSALLHPASVERISGTSARSMIDVRVAEAERLSVSGDTMSSISRYDQRFYLPALLDRMDRMTMAHSLEGRVPFLDVPLAEWASRVPSSFKLGAFENKRVVKQLADRYLSEKITRGPKSGFGVPFGTWLRSPHWKPLVDRLLDGTHPASSLIDHHEVRTIVNRHMKGERDHGDELWLLSNLYLWSETTF